MQKSTKKAPARKTSASSKSDSRKTVQVSPSFPAKRIRKPLTKAQRARKNQHDRERRARLRQQAEAAKAVAPQPCKSPVSNVCCVGSCPAAQTKNGCRCHAKPSVPAVPATKPVAPISVSGLFQQLGEYVVSEALKHFQDLPALSVPGIPVSGSIEQVEPGVTRQRVRLADGRTLVVTQVDGDVVDPLSDYSPLPSAVKRQFLVRRLADEIAALVDAQWELA